MKLSRAYIVSLYYYRVSPPTDEWLEESRDKAVLREIFKIFRKICAYLIRDAKFENKGTHDMLFAIVLQLI